MVNKYQNIKSSMYRDDAFLHSKSPSRLATTSYYQGLSNRFTLRILTRLVSFYNHQISNFYYKSIRLQIEQYFVPTPLHKKWSNQPKKNPIF